MKKLFYRSALIVALAGSAAGLSACGGGSVVSDSSSKPSQSAGSSTAAQPANSPAVSAAANATPQLAEQPTPSPTVLPIIKEAQSKPGVPVAVPESMRRPLTPEEMQKALQAMPPEVRARIQGMQAAPPGVRPGQPTPTPKK